MTKPAGAEEATRHELARLGLEPLGPVPADLPDAWLARLEAQAARLSQAAELAEWDLMQGRDAVPSGVYRTIARQHLLTEELEAACATRLPAEAGTRRRWLAVLHAECQGLRLATDPEVLALTDAIEHEAWRFTPAPGAPDADPRVVARQRAMAALPLAERLREPTLQLVRRRNALARAEGHADFFAMRCHLQDMPVAWHAPLFEEVEAAVAPAMARLVAELSALAGEPVREQWQLRGAMRTHRQIPTGRLPAAGAAELARIDARLGLPSVGDAVKVAVGPFASGGLCNVIDPARDVRILVADWVVGSGPQAVLLHEYGHARHAIGMARTGHPHHLATGMKGAPAAVCEGLALLFETICEEAGWMAEVAGATAQELAIWPDHARNRRTLATAADLLETAFERALYADPEADHEAGRRALARRIMGLALEDEARLWPANPVSASFPAHNAAYVLASMAAAQMREALGGELWDNRAVGPWLEEHFYRPAGARPWRESVEVATGAPLAASALVTRLATA